MPRLQDPPALAPKAAYTATPKATAMQQLGAGPQAQASPTRLSGRHHRHHHGHCRHGGKDCAGNITISKVMSVGSRQVCWVALPVSHDNERAQLLTNHGPSRGVGDTAITMSRSVGLVVPAQ